jgi:hypothetical protein
VSVICSSICLGYARVIVNHADRRAAPSAQPAAEFIPWTAADHVQAVTIKPLRVPNQGKIFIFTVPDYVHDDLPEIQDH